MKILRTLIILLFLLISFYFVNPQSSFAWSPADVPMSYTLYDTVPQYPYQMNFDNNGNLFVTITGDDVTYKYNSAGTFVTSFGTAFSGPTGVDIDSLGNVYVANYQQDKLEKYDNDGVPITSFGTTGTGDYQFSSIYAIAIDSNNNVFVADAGNNRIQKFNSALVYQSTITGNGGAFNFPESIAIDGSDNLYVLDSGNNRVQVFDTAGTYIRTVTGNGGAFNYPEGMTVDTYGNLYVADSNNNEIQVFNSSGVFQQEFGSFGVGLGQFQYVTGLAMSSTGILVAGDQNRIQRIVFDRVPAVIDSVDITPSGAVINDSTPIITGTVTDSLNDIISVEFRVDGGSYSACSADDSTFDEISEAYTCQVVTPLIDGSHTIEIRTTDDHTNTNSGGNLGSITFTVDTTAAVVTIDAISINNSTSDSTPSITGNVTDSASILDSVEFRVDGGSYSACTAADSTFDETNEDFTCYIVTALTDGSHNIEIRSTDDLGNINSGGNLGSYNFGIDLNPGNVTIDSLSSNATTDSTPSITGLVVDSVTKITLVEYRIDGGTYQPCSADDGAFDELSEDFTCAVLDDLSDGSHTIDIRSSDDWGHYNSGGNLDSYTFTVTLPTQNDGDTPIVNNTGTITDSEEKPVVDEEEVIEENPIDETPTPNIDGENPRNFEGDNPTSDFINLLSNTVKNVQKGIKDFVSNLTTFRTADLLQEGAILTGLATTALFTPSVLSTFYYSTIQALQNMFIFFGLKKKGRPYGYVYNSITKAPLSLAIIRVFNTEGTLVATAVTNTFGVFNLDIESGRYKITAVKGGYMFPSEIVTGNTDGSISNIYDGNIVNIDQKIVEKMSIAMDPSDENVKGISLLGVRLGRVLSVFLSLLFVLGAVYSCYVVYVAPFAYNIAIFGLYVITAIIYLMSYLKTSKVGKVTLSNEPISGIQVALKLINLDKVVDTRYTDEDGKYSFVATPGEYEIVVNDKRYEEVDYQQKPINIKGDKPEVVFRDFEITRAK